MKNKRKKDEKDKEITLSRIIHNKCKRMQTFKTLAEMYQRSCNLLIVFFILGFTVYCWQVNLKHIWKTQPLMVNNGGKGSICRHQVTENLIWDCVIINEMKRAILNKISSPFSPCNVGFSPRFHHWQTTILSPSCSLVSSNLLPPAVHFSSQPPKLTC